MRIALLGYDRQGRSAYDYWGKGNEITICDRDPQVDLPPHVEVQLGDNYLDNLDRFNLIIRTPGLHPRKIVEANGDRILRKVTTVTEEFFRNCPATIIGVTGSKGKGTTSTLITEILKAAGKTVYLGGNIGIPPLDLLKHNIQPTDYVVLELANYQLIDLHVSPPIAVCLVVTPEHLDWHKDMQEYIDSKKNIFKYQNDTDTAIFNRLSDFSTEVASVSPALKLSYEVPAPHILPEEKTGAYILNEYIYYEDIQICAVSEVALLGRHNLENICAAIAATWKLIDGNTQLLTSVFKSFKNLPNRLELVRTLNDVDYYNDSFSSAIVATVAAIETITKPKVLIVGGYDRGLDVSELAQAIVAHKTDIHKVIVIGQTAEKIQRALSAAGFTEFEVLDKPDMIDIVTTAQAASTRGDAIVFSPGFASFDMFKDFEERGTKFRDSVNKL